MSITSRVDKTVEFTSNMHRETAFTDPATESVGINTDKLKASVIDESIELASSSLNETMKSATTCESSDSESESVDMDMSKAHFVDDAMEFTSSSLKETKPATSSEFGDSPTKDTLDHLPVASSSSSIVASPWEKFSSFDVYLNYDNVFTDQHFSHHLSDELVTAGIQISPYFHLLAGSRYLRTSEVRASIVILSANYASSIRCLDELLLILERKANSNHFVLPVFYEVEASDVREHRKIFALRWYQTAAIWKEKVDRWKAALTEVATLPGFSVSRNNEATVIKEIVSAVRHTLYPDSFSTPPHLTRRETQADDA